MKNKGGVILSEAKDLLFSCSLDSIRDIPRRFSESASEDPPAIGCKLQTANCKL
jgi:hypothetical protein